MPVGALIPAAASVGSTVFGMMSGSENNEMAEGYANQQAGLAGEQAAWSSLLRERYMNQFIPLENKLIGEAKRPVRKMAGYLGSMGQIESGYRDAGANVGRMMAGRYQNGSGLEDSAMLSNDRNRVRDLSKNYTTWDTERQNRLMNLTTLGRSLPSQSMSGLSSAASTYGSLANLYGQAAKDSYSSSGNTMGSLGQMLMLGKYFGNGSSGLGGLFNFGKSGGTSGSDWLGNMNASNGWNPLSWK